MKTLSKRQAEAYDFIAEKLAATGAAPTLREIRDRLGIKSVGTIGNLMKTLAEKGAIVQGGYRFRGMRLKRPSTGRPVQAMDPVCVPQIDRIHEGKPLLSSENIVGYVSFDRQLIGDAEVFCFQLSDAGPPTGEMRAGDVALVSLRHKAGPSDIVATVVGGVIQPLVFSGESAQRHEHRVLGKVIALFRKITN